MIIVYNKHNNKTVICATRRSDDRFSFARSPSAALTKQVTGAVLLLCHQRLPALPGPVLSPRRARWRGGAPEDVLVENLLRAA